MSKGTTFSYAIRNREWTHVDEVPRGLDCNCVCPDTSSTATKLNSANDC